VACKGRSTKQSNMKHSHSMTPKIITTLQST
jgi:hypothetical protein